MNLTPCHDLIASIDDVVALGNAALSRGEWKDARDALAAAVEHREEPEVYEGLATAEWHLEDGPHAIDYRQRAYLLYTGKGNRVAAARVATLLAWDHATFRNQPGVASGWLRRAHQLLDGQPLVPERVWLAVLEAGRALSLSHDPVTAERLGNQAAEWARALGSIDLEVLGTAVSGVALIGRAEVDAGMARLDEAGAAVAAGELHDRTAIGLTFCHLILGCSRAGEYGRAVQWCDQLSEFSSRWRLRALAAVCRTHRAEVLMWQGDWDGAESELVSAVEELRRSRPGMVGEARAALGELRRRQGRFVEAAAMFEDAEDHPTAQLGRAALALDQGDARRALEEAERFLRTLPPDERVLRAWGIETVVAAQVAAGAVEGTPHALAEIRGPRE